MTQATRTKPYYWQQPARSNNRCVARNRRRVENPQWQGEEADGGGREGGRRNSISTSTRPPCCRAQRNWVPSLRSSTRPCRSRALRSGRGRQSPTEPDHEVSYCNKPTPTRLKRLMTNRVPLHESSRTEHTGVPERCTLATALQPSDANLVEHVFVNGLPRRCPLHLSSELHPTCPCEGEHPRTLSHAHVAHSLRESLALAGVLAIAGSQKLGPSSRNTTPPFLCHVLHCLERVSLRVLRHDVEMLLLSTCPRTLGVLEGNIWSSSRL